MDRKRMVLELFFFFILSVFGVILLFTRKPIAIDTKPYLLTSPVAPFNERMIPQDELEGGISYDSILDKQSKYRSA